MRITTFTDFGLRALFLLGKNSPELLSASTVAEHFGVSQHHMAKAMQALVRAGYAKGIRGAHGGVRLARDPSAIRIRQVVRSLDSQYYGDGCTRLQNGNLEYIFEEAQEGFFRELDRFTLSDFIAAAVSKGVPPSGPSAQRGP